MFVVKNANPKTFRIIDGAYATDETNLYYYGSLINNADYKTFKTLKVSEYVAIAVDKNNVYLGEKIFEEADPSTFYYDEKDDRNNFDAPDTLDKKFIIGDKNNEWEYYPIISKINKIRKK